MRALELDENSLCFNSPDALVFFKDNAHECGFECHPPTLECRNFCQNARFCYSAVCNFHVLEYYNGKLYKGFE